jgi:hypothetical protein
MGYDGGRLVLLNLRSVVFFEKSENNNIKIKKLLVLWIFLEPGQCGLHGWNQLRRAALY